MGLGSWLSGVGNTVKDFAASFAGGVGDVFSGVSQGNLQRLADSGLISSAAQFGSSIGRTAGQIVLKAAPIIAARVLPPVPIISTGGTAGGDPLGGLLGRSAGSLAREITGAGRTRTSSQRGRGDSVSAPFMQDPATLPEVQFPSIAQSGFGVDLAAGTIGGLLQEGASRIFGAAEDVLRGDTGLIPGAGPAVADFFFGEDSTMANGEPTTSGGRSLVSASGRGAISLAPAAARARAPRSLIFPVPTATGGSRLVMYRNMGSPILWSGDLSSVKRVKRARTRANKALPSRK